MNKLNNEEIDILVKLLNKWFNWFEVNKENKLRNPNFWAQNKIGNILKERLKKLKHWKNKSKGREANLIQLEKNRQKRVEIRKLKEKELEAKRSNPLL